VSSDLILAHMVQTKLETVPDLDVLTFVAVGKDGGFIDATRTYQELWDNGQRVAKGLAREGMAPGDRFGLLLLNHPEFVDAMVGASIAASVFVPIDPRTKGDKLSYMLGHAECRGVVVADYALDNLLAVAPALPHLEWIWVLETEGACAVVEDPPEGLSARRLSEVLSGSVPRLPIASTDEMAPMQMIGLTPDDRPYTGLSLTHANAQLITLGCVLQMGLRGVISLKFTKSRLWDICRHYGCTMFNLLGGMTTAIYADPPRANDADNPVRYVLSAGMPKAIWNDFHERFNVEIFEFYGCAEGGLTLNPPGQGGPIGSIGKAPDSAECTIRDEDDREAPNGQSGELCFRNADGSCPPVHYYKDAEASSEKTAGGWFRSGDVGHKDAEGWLYFEYRSGGGIRRNGDFVSPAFVEKVIAEVPGVTDVFVYGVHLPSNVPGEKEVVAAIEVDEKRFDPNALIEACRKNLESNFVPSYLQLVDEIPKTASEKPQERFLLDRFDPSGARIITV